MGVIYEVCASLTEHAIDAIAKPFADCYLEMDSGAEKNELCVVCGDRVSPSDSRFCSETCRRTFDYQSTAV